MKFKVSVSGLSELDKNLGQLSKATARNTLRRVLLKAGQPMADTAARLAPDDPDTGAPDLHTSILVSTKIKNEVGHDQYAAVMKAGGTKQEAVAALRTARREAAGESSFAEVYVGPSAKIYYAHFPEFGTATQRPRPFMRPAFDQERGTVIEVIKRELGGEIDKAVARMKRREARKAARGR